MKQSGRADVVEVFAYPELPGSCVPDWEAWGGGAGAPAAAAHPDPPASNFAETEKRLVDEARRSFEAGRAQGFEQGGLAERAAQGTTQQRLAEQLERLAEAFVQERDRYLNAVEAEVVKLALAVAARILRREAQMDPLLLTGAVRVALGQLAASTRVCLRVPPGDLELWKEAVALLPNLGVQPEVLPGKGMRLGDCLVETALGSVDVGVRAQLSEIEHGFFDRAAAAPEPELAGVEGGA